MWLHIVTEALHSFSCDVVLVLVISLLKYSKMGETTWDVLKSTRNATIQNTISIGKILVIMMTLLSQ